MLARRFTIVCLMALIFGMALARLVAEADRRPDHHRHHDVLSRCGAQPGLACISSPRIDNWPRSAAIEE